ncbi:MAG: phosphonate C-P lyase system protein PhnH [Pseudomonadota bacterium]
MTQPHPSASEARSNAAFDALLWALSRPGQLRPLGGPEAIVEALVDRECTVFAEDQTIALAAARAGAALVGAEQADYVFAGVLQSAALLGAIKKGSDLHPEEGATLIVSARFGAGERLRLTGPGVDGALHAQVGGLPAGFWALRAGVTRYPMGFDLFLVDDAEVMGLPRSTQVEVL